MGNCRKEPLYEKCVVTQKHMVYNDLWEKRDEKDERKRDERIVNLVFVFFVCSGWGNGMRLGKWGIKRKMEE